MEKTFSAQWYSKIPTFKEACEFVKLYSEYSHSKQEIDGAVLHSFKYNFSSPAMYEGDLSDGRLNMRGLTYLEKDGEFTLVALPFPKFFNNKEKPWVSYDLKDAVYIADKVDGSLISVVNLGDELLCKSMKSFESDVAKEAQKLFNMWDNISGFCSALIEQNLSPMFEYTSPSQQIVLFYNEPQLTFLGCRDMTTGEIVLSNNKRISDLLKPFAIDVVQSFTFEEYSKHMDRLDVEGAVALMPDGQMIKTKTMQYCEDHRVCTNLTPKDIVQSYINQTSDDHIALLYQKGLDQKAEFIERVIEQFTMHLAMISSDILMALGNPLLQQAMEKGDRKWIGLNYSASKDPFLREVASYAFDKIKGDLDSYRRKVIKKAVDTFVFEGVVTESDD